MGEVAAYCDVALDGWYSQESIRKIAAICFERLRNMRAAIILLS